MLTKVVTVAQQGPAGAGVGDHESSQSFSHVKIVTSATRPSSPFDGQVIYQTDTKDYWFYNGDTDDWEELVPDPEGEAAVAGELLCLAALTTNNSVSNGTIETVIFNTVHRNEGDIYNNVTGVITLTAGSYRFDVNVGVSSASSSDDYAAWLEPVTGTIQPANMVAHASVRGTPVLSMSGGVIIPSGTATLRVRFGNGAGSGGSRSIGTHTYSSTNPPKGVTTLAVFSA